MRLTAQGHRRLRARLAAVILAITAAAVALLLAARGTPAPAAARPPTPALPLLQIAPPDADAPADLLRAATLAPVQADFVGDTDAAPALSAADSPHIRAPQAPADAAAPPRITPDSLNGVELSALQNRFQSVVERAAPSVVAISAAAKPIAPTLQLMRVPPQRLAALMEATTRVVGSGIVIDRGGLILTNEHVVGTSEHIFVTLDDGRVFAAMVVGSDPFSDLAVLKIAAADLVPAKLGDGSNVRRGQWALALGNPYGLAARGEMNFSVGVVSATARWLPKLQSRESRRYGALIQSTTQINPGNSGGPLLDIDGHVIGINVAVILPSGPNTNGIGFAMPLTPSLLEKVDQLKRGNPVPYADLGLAVVDATAAETDAAGTAAGSVRVDRVAPGSAAMKAGIKPGDLITHAAGVPLDGADGFASRVDRLDAARETQLRIVRGGQSRDVAIRPTLRPLPGAVQSSTRRLKWMGATLAEADGTGVRVTDIESGSPLAAVLSAGMLITRVEDKPVRTLAQLMDAAGASGSPAVIATRPPAAATRPTAVAGSPETP